LLLVTGLNAYIGKVAALQGDVRIQRGGEEIRAVVGSEVEEGDTILTKATSRAQVYFKDETVISIGKSSIFKVEGFFYDGDGQNSANGAAFNMASGAFKVMTGKIGKIAPQAFKLTTRTATIGIRGTHFLGNIAPEADQIACTDGKISVGTLDGQAEVLVSAGQITFVIPGEVPTPPREFSADELKSLSSAATNGGVKGDKKEGEPAKDGEEESGESSIAEEQGIAQGVRVEEVGERLQQLVQQEVQQGFLSAKPRLDYEFSWVYAYTDATAYYDQAYYGEYESVADYIAWYDNIADALTYAQAENPEWNLVVYHADKYAISENNEYIEWGTWELGWAYTEEDQTVGFNEKGYYLTGSDITPAATVQNLIDSNTEFSYSGSVIGSIAGNNYDEINNIYGQEILGHFTDGSFDATINFGTGAINGSMAFTATNGESWNNNIAGTLGIDGSYFDGYGVDSQNGNYTDLTGAFYGSNAQAIGGEFSTYDGDSGHYAIGVFEGKAIAQ
jgi:hypothetical protein